MYLVRSEINNPLFNIALEEHLFKEYPEREFLIVYINAPSVIIGKHQNIFAEIDYAYSKQEKLVLLRRISGGGTVYHDLGNLNFTFINNVSPGMPLVDFDVSLKPINSFLQTMGLDSYTGSKSDILINSNKVSGNAMHIFKNRRMHHGTLLFKSNLENLNKAIKGPEANYSGKAVSSNRSKVCNISDFLSEKISLNKFVNHFVSYFHDLYKGLATYTLTDVDTQAIASLIEKKYSLWSWNFAYAPDYVFKKDCLTNKGKIYFSFKVRKGLITEVETETLIKNNELQHELSYFEKGLTGKKHTDDDLCEVLQECKTLLTLKGKDAEALSLFFF